jgi:hypothetical protein
MLKYVNAGFPGFLFCNTPGPRKEQQSKPIMKEMGIPSKKID